MVLLPDLLDLVGSYLETFTLLQSDALIIPPVHHRLPRLRDLTLLMGVTVMLNEELRNPSEHGTTSGGSALSSSDMLPYSPLHTQPSPPPLSYNHRSCPKKAHDNAQSISATPSFGHAEHARFPVLERLHIICGRHRDWTLRDALVHLPRLAPNLTNLRISNATYTHGSHECVASFLHDALGIPRRTEGQESTTPTQGPGRQSVAGAEREPLDQSNLTLRSPAMPRLRRVAVHSIPPPARDRCEMSHKGYRALAGAMQELREACDLTSDTRLRWTESERARHQVWEEVCWKHWTDTIEGREGASRDIRGILETL
ncbi:hypothetical protein BD309DRAFT_986431 [Dichomitus squalens]|nr:hypothetical protein BD309DRAFT_986431 [Dichomitus squalens]